MRLLASAGSSRLIKRLHRDGLSPLNGVEAGEWLMPLRDLLEGLSESVDDYCGFAAAEALDGLLGGLVGIVGGVPEANDDAVVGQVCANALADGAGLREGEGRQGRDEDDGVGLFGE